MTRAGAPPDGAPERSTAADMYSYAVFGGRLHSSIAFPELRAREDGDATWTLNRDAPRAEPAGAILLGEAEYAGGVTMRLSRYDGGLRLNTSDNGSYEIRAGGGELTWLTSTEPHLAAIETRVADTAGRAVAARPTAASDTERLARFDLLGRVLPLALHEAGMLCLHGSGVVLPSGLAVAFVAPKHSGKSTLAVALARAGALLLSDDVLAVEMDSDSPRVRPGVHSVRLWPDAVARVAARTPADDRQRKVALHDLPDEMLATAPAPLAAIYALHAPAGGIPEAARERLRPVDATLSILRNSTNARLLGGAAAPDLLDRAAALARTVPVYRLSVPRDFERLSASIAQIAEWHGSTVAQAVEHQL